MIIILLLPGGGSTREVVNIDPTREPIKTVPHRSKARQGSIEGLGFRVEGTCSAPKHMVVSLNYCSPNGGKLL